MRASEVAFHMDILGVPADRFALNLGISALVTMAVFYPALSSFGAYLFGTEDISLFMWVFWHFSNSISSGGNPFVANEIFYPYGASLALTTTSPLQALAYHALPSSWGAFGKMTFLQVASFILGGAFSFCLVYRFTKSFLPSMAGSWAFNFSAYHFEKSLHHLNYNMAFPLLALFFIFYFEFMGRDRNSRTLAFLSASLLLLALGEMTVAIMAGFIVFIDIFWRYLVRSGVKPVTSRNIVLLAAAAMCSLIAHEALAALQAPAAIVYAAPSLFFFAGCLLALGPRNLAESEKSLCYIRSMALCALPLLAYMALLALQPSYQFKPDSLVANAVYNAVPLDYLLVPSRLQAVSGSGLFPALSAYADTGVYIGIVLIILLAISFLDGRASREEEYFRNMSVLCMLFSFPILAIGDASLAVTPFFAGPLFPLLAVLRVPVRFMMFALLFISVTAGLALKRLSERLGGGMGAYALIMVSLLLLAQQWPAMDKFAFDAPVPGFYKTLAAEPGQKSLFLYPGFDYCGLLREIYCQTIHGKQLSYGLLSRDQSAVNPLLSLYKDAQDGKAGPENISDFAAGSGYGYVVLQKKFYVHLCLEGYRKAVPLDGGYVRNVTATLEKRFGNRVYDDEWVSVFQARKG